mgnify:CR=1 FL=1
MEPNHLGELKFRAHSSGKAGKRELRRGSCATNNGARFAFALSLLLLYTIACDLHPHLSISTRLCTICGGMHAWLLLFSGSKMDFTSLKPIARSDDHQARTMRRLSLNLINSSFGASTHD